MNQDTRDPVPRKASDLLSACLQREAAELSLRESLLAPACKRLFSGGDGVVEILVRLLSRKLADPDLTEHVLEDLFAAIYSNSPELIEFAALDVEAILRRDPASESALLIVLSQKGFHALQTHRIAHALWMDARKDIAMYLQSLSSRLFGVDIHPACIIGHSTMLDHATGIVIGETCVIQDGVSIMQGVTLGGTGKFKGDRHPKIGTGVLIGAGAVLLGNIKVGEGAKIGAGSVVLAEVLPHTTVAGVPAKVVGAVSTICPAEEMDQFLPVGSSSKARN